MEKRLTRIKGFLPYIFIVFLNAMTDLGHKIVIQNTVFKCYDGSTQIFLTAVVNALILLPFIFMFSPSGFISDKYPKHRVIFITAAIAIPLTVMITVCYFLGWFEVAFFMTLLLALQSAFYSPAKYGYIKELTGKENIAKANAAVQSVTIIAILAGAVVYSMFFEFLLTGGETTPSAILKKLPVLGVFLVIGATVETVFAWFLPRKSETRKEVFFQFRKYASGSYLKSNMGVLRRTRVIWLSIIALSIFWAVNQVVFATFGAFLKETLNENNTIIAQGLLSIGGLGVIAGSVIAGKVSKNYIETGLIPAGVAGMFVTLYLIPSLSSIPGFAFCLFVYGMSGGMLIVPLNSLIQFNAKNSELGKVLAGNNFIQNIFMLCFLLVTIFSAKAGFTSKQLLFAMAAVVFGGAVYTVITLPQSLFRYIVRVLLARGYSVDVEGLNNIPSSKGTLLLGNHSSWIDWAVLQIACPRRIRFVMERSIYERWYLRWFLDFFGVVPIAKGSSKRALEKITNALNNGDVVALFPEGTITRTGQLCYFHSGFERAAKGTDSVIVPFYINGLWGSTFSFASKILRRSLKTGTSRLITVAFGNQMGSDSSSVQVKEAVQKLSVEGWKQYADSLDPVHVACLKSLKKKQGDVCLTDSRKRRWTGRALLADMFSFFHHSASFLRHKKVIGVIMPNSIEGILTNLSLLMRGRVPVNLQVDLSEKMMMEQVEQSNAEAFILNRESDRVLKDIHPVCYAYMESKGIVLADDVFEKQHGFGRWIRKLYISLMPVWMLRVLFFARRKQNDIAVSVFTRMTHDAVQKQDYSHLTLACSIKQMAAVFNIDHGDVVVSTLPLFHSAGLILTTLMPLVEGVPAAVHHSMNDSLKIAKLTASTEGTFLFTTPEALKQFTNHAKLHPLMFSSLRFVATGFDSVSKELSIAFKDKFGLDIHEGYGLTELSPVITVNVPDRMVPGYWFAQQGIKKGTLGQPLPGNTIQIVDPVTFEKKSSDVWGLICIATPYIQGTVDDTRLIIDENGLKWWMTNDIGLLDSDGFLVLKN